jgi:glycosyltransferase involved in cell wall biosynthesis
MAEPHRLAIVVSHPIQHFVHLYRELASRADVEVHVFYCARIGLEPYFDRDMNTEIAWKTNLLGGYSHTFLPESEAIASATSMAAVNNPSIGPALEAWRPTAVMVYGYSHATTLRAIIWCRLRRVPILMTGDGDNVRQRPAFKAVMRRMVLFLLLTQVSAFLTVGDQNEAMLRTLGAPSRKMFRSPFPIDEVVYREHRARRAEIRRELRAELDLPAQAVVFLFVGKLARRKRPADLIAAWKGMRSMDPEAAGRTHLLFCGEGVERSEIERLARTTGAPVTMAGFVNVDRLPGFYCAADVLVHPSEHDPHPLVGSEAAAIGLPLLLRDRVGLIGPTDIGQEGRNAIAYPCGDTEALAKVLVTLVADSTRRDRMSQASVAVFEECSLEVSAAGVLTALASLRPNARSLAIRS